MKEVEQIYKNCKYVWPIKNGKKEFLYFECHRMPPSPCAHFLSSGEIRIFSAFPNVGEGDYCYEFKEKVCDKK